MRLMRHFLVFTLILIVSSCSLPIGSEEPFLQLINRFAQDADF